MIGAKDSAESAGGQGAVGLVLGAGGGAGGQWIRGVLDGLHATTSFRPEHASTLVGTSIGAIRAAGIGPFEAPAASTVRALVAAAAPPRRQGPIGSFLAAARALGGQGVAALSRPGAPDPLTWVETIHPETRAQVCSVRRLPPRRRVSSIADAAEPEREIAASAAIPFGAQAVELDGALHVDGAVWSVTNADLADPAMLDVLIVIAPLVTTDGGTIVSALGRHQLAAELQPWARAGKPVLVFAPSSTQYAQRQERQHHRVEGEALARQLTATLS